MSTLSWIYLAGLLPAWYGAVRLMAWDGRRKGLDVRREDARMFGAVAAAAAILWPGALLVWAPTVTALALVGHALERVAMWIAGGER